VAKVGQEGIMSLSFLAKRFFRRGPQIPRLAMSQDIRVIAVAAICAFIAGFFGLWNALLEMEVLDLVSAKLPLFSEPSTEVLP
jgi:hypothetical protein